MKVSKFSLAVLGAALVLSPAAFAGNKGKLHLAETVTIEGKQLKPGDYVVELNGNGADAKLNIAKGRDTVVSVPARVDSADTSHVRTGYGSRTEADGSKSLTSVFIDGTKYDLTGGASSAASTPAR